MINVVIQVNEKGVDTVTAEYCTGRDETLAFIDYITPFVDKLHEATIEWIEAREE